MILLGAIALTTPLMLLGMAAVMLPVAAHLLNRRARQRIVFPTIRLLREAAASQSRLFRMRRLLLLFLRCLAIICIAWAFARPVWVDREASGGEGRSGDAGVVLVIDVSASTGQQESGVAVSHQMVASAAAALDDLRPGRDVVDLVYAAAQPRAAFGRLIANIDAARADLQQAKPTQERADLQGAIDLARSLLEEHDGPRRIIVFSDMQATNWADVDRGEGVTVVEIGEGTAANVALSRGRIFPARPIAGHPATAAVTVTNHSQRPQRVHVEAMAGERRLGTRDVNLDAGEQRELSFEVTLEEAGDRAVTFTIGPDDLAIDNRAYVVAEVVERVSVALISDSDPAEPGGSAFYLARALSPAPGNASSLEVRHVRSTDVAAAALQDVDAVVLADAAPLTQAAAQALTEYVRGGGGLIVFGGEAPTPLRPFTPVPLAQPVTRHITGGAWSSPALRHFDLQAQDALSRIPIVTQIQAGELAGDALVLLRYVDGTPAVAEHAYGGGRVVLTTFGVGPPSELPKHGLFVAMVHGLLDQVRPRGAGSESVTVGTGAQVVVDIPAQTPLNVKAPDGNAVLVQRSTEGDRTTLQFPPLKQAGIYTVASPRGEVALIAANVEERESDLRRSVEAAEASTKAQDGARTSDADGPMLNVNAKPLWPLFIVAALVAIALELAIVVHGKR